MPPGLPGALFVAVAVTLPTTCVVLVHLFVERRPRRPGYWWRIGVLQMVTFLTALGLLLGPLSGLLRSAETHPAVVPTPAEADPGLLTGEGDLARGYRAGHALATGRQHRGAPRPRPEALAAMARLHGRNEPPAFAEGFRRGYLAGQAEATGTGAPR